MSVFILDTDIMTLYQQGQPRVVEHVLAHPMPELAIAVVSVEEELTGWYTKLRKARKRDQLARAYQRLSEAVLSSHVSRSCRLQRQPSSATRACAPLTGTSAKTICGLLPSPWNMARPS
jgi:hypothetical protein